MSEQTPSFTEATGADANADIRDMGYEQARDELANIVGILEQGRAPLEESMRLWERGEALAAHAQSWLDGAQAKIDTALADRDKA